MKRGSCGRARSRNAGFSMVEVIVATAILAIGISALIPMLGFNVKSNALSKSVGMANYLAEKKLEQIRSWPVYNTTLVDGNTRLGINTANTALFTTENVSMMTLGNPVTYSVAPELYHNGYTQDCNPLLFGAAGGSRNVNDGAAMNTKTIAGDCGTGYRGEDFKVIRVTVSWNDIFGGHSIQRHAYISKF